MSQKTINLTNCYTTKNLIKSTFQQSDSDKEAIQIVKDAIDTINARVDSIERDTTVDSHTHGNLKMDGTVGDGSQKNYNVVTDNNGRISTATFRSIPTKTSDLNNDSGFLTSHQDISGKLNINLGSTKANLNLETDSEGKIVTKSKYVHPTNYQSRNLGPTKNEQLIFGGDFTVANITSNTEGHITGGKNYTLTMPSLPSTMPPSDHTHNVSDINNFPSTMPPSVHQHTKSDITDWSDWELVGRYPDNRDTDDNGGWQRIYSNGLLVYAFIRTWPVPAKSTTWSAAGYLNINNSFYAPPTQLFCSYVKNSLIMLQPNTNDNKTYIKVACYNTEQTITTNFYATFLYPCGLNILNLPIGE